MQSPYPPAPAGLKGGDKRISEISVPFQGTEISELPGFAPFPAGKGAEGCEMGDCQSRYQFYSQQARSALYPGHAVELDDLLVDLANLALN